MNANSDAMVDFGGTPGEAVGATDDEGMVVDFSNVGDQAGFAVLPRGIYNCQVHDCTYGQSQSSGNNMWTLQLEVVDGEFAKRKLFTHAVFAPSSMPRTKKTIAAIAPELLNGPFNAKSVADGGLLLGRQCRARIDIRKYMGEDRNNVRDVLPPDANAGGGAASFLG